jgi:hypothetical protein
MKSILGPKEHPRSLSKEDSEDSNSRPFMPIINPRKSVPQQKKSSTKMQPLNVLVFQVEATQHPPSDSVTTPSSPLHH